MINDVSSICLSISSIFKSSSIPGLAGDHLSQRLVLIAAHRCNVTWACKEAGTGRTVNRWKGNAVTYHLDAF